ncbi:hypothetical protein [Methylobacterium tarhaniae]|uniref:hypothetical protein n=1 Tax=Methylobacterium tarhaniae TaxID=1187852 RepID=UPI0012EEA26F|nr:hypothetical protein [Methylobacterium tarhaniae]
MDRRSAGYKDAIADNPTSALRKEIASMSGLVLYRKIHHKIFVEFALEKMVELSPAMFNSPSAAFHSTIVTNFSYNPEHICRKIDKICPGFGSSAPFSFTA